MPASLAMKNVIYDTYTVKGKTLAEIAKSIKKVGPVDPNDKKRVAFLTTTKLDCALTKAKYKPDGKPKLDKKSGWYEAKSKLGSLKLTLIPTVNCPRRQVSGLSARALVEWFRFYGACLLHEAKHVDKAKKECDKIAKEVDKLRGVGLAETEAAAQKAADEDLAQAVHIFFFDNRERLNELHRKFDHATHHGEKQGALLDTSVI